MTYKVVIQPRAVADAEEAYRYIARRNPENAARWFNALFDAMYSLETFPNRCPLAPEAQYLRLDVRQLTFGKYRILYVVVGNSVRILHVRHGARSGLSRTEFEGPSTHNQ